MVTHYNTHLLKTKKKLYAENHLIKWISGNVEHSIVDWKSTSMMPDK